MQIDQTDGCCSLLEIKWFEDTDTAETIINKLKDYYQDDFDWNYTTEFPFAMFATTKSDQWKAEKALKELKFKPTKFKSRHAEGSEKILTHWWRSTPPTVMAVWFRNLKRRKPQ